MKDSPHEACGIIVPDLDQPPDEWVHQLINRSPSPENSYAIDPSTMRTLVKSPERWDDVVVWHTHPRGNVGPSEGDMQCKAKGVTYLVVALPTGEATRF